MYKSISLKRNKPPTIKSEPTNDFEKMLVDIIDAVHNLAKDFLNANEDADKIHPAQFISTICANCAIYLLDGAIQGPTSEIRMEMVKDFTCLLSDMILDAWKINEIKMQKLKEQH